MFESNFKHFKKKNSFNQFNITSKHNFKFWENISISTHLLVFFFFFFLFITQFLLSFSYSRELSFYLFVFKLIHFPSKRSYIRHYLLILYFQFI